MQGNAWKGICMARNPVQFQKGTSLNAFLSLYGTEDQCFDALYRWRWPNGFECPHCGHDRGCQLNTRKLQQCHRCHRQTSITAGTLFEATKLPLTVWFQAIHLITQDKKGISAMTLQPPSGHLLQRGVAPETQADAGDDGARPRTPAQRPGSSSTMPVSAASEAAASAGEGRRPRPLSWPPSRPTSTDTRCA